jgi:hypothetical protein
MSTAETILRYVTLYALLPSILIGGSLVVVRFWIVVFFGAPVACMAFQALRASINNGM